jgi:hypothetical protein
VVKDADVRRNALGYSLSTVEIDGVVAEQHPVEAVQTVHESGQDQDEQR